jgi:hypothetical protein
MEIEKLLAEKYLYPLGLTSPSNSWKVYRSLKNYKIYVQTHKSYYGKDKPSDYYLWDFKNNKLYCVYCGRVGGIAGFIRLLEKRPTDFSPIEILKLARDITKQHEKHRQTESGLIANYCGKLWALEELARKTNNLDIAEEISQMIGGCKREL